LTENWARGWSTDKRDWCCTYELRGCPQATEVFAKFSPQPVPRPHGAGWVLATIAVVAVGAIAAVAAAAFGLRRLRGRAERSPRAADESAHLDPRAEREAAMATWKTVDEPEEPAAPAVVTPPVKVHPIVIFSILDHYLRRQEGQDRVIGTLLGTRTEDGLVEVTNAYAVPHTEAGGEVAVGQQFNKTMFDLLSRVNAREEIVGWYATAAPDGSTITDASSLIHDFYARECAAPVHVVVDTRLEGDAGVVTTAFVGAKADESAEVYDFSEIANELVLDDGERACLSRMIEGQEGEAFTTAESIATVCADEDATRDDVDDLLSAVDDVVNYVKAQKKKGEPVDPKVARALDGALAMLPQIDRAVKEGSLQHETQDVLMVSYLASITKAQLAITSKIHESF